MANCSNLSDHLIRNLNNDIRINFVASKTITIIRYLFYYAKCLYKL